MQFHKSFHLPKGAQFILSCNSFSGQPQFRFSFFKDGHPLHQSDRLTVDSKDSFSQLIIKNLSEDDSGNFSCTVENSVGSDHQWTVLSVKGLPSECLIFVQNLALGRSFGFLDFYFSICAFTIICASHFFFDSYSVHNDSP